MKPIIILLTIVLTGCQSTVIVRSQPEGAYVRSSNGAVAGMSPVVFSYQIKNGVTPKDANGCWIVQGATAQWASGAVRSYQHFTLCGSEYATYNIVMDRPLDAPNIQADLNFELQLRSNRIAAEQARAANQAAAAATFAASASLLTPQQPPSNNQTYVMPGGKVVNCSTVGSVTNCF